MNTRKTLIALALLLSALFTSEAAGRRFTTTSPDGRLTLYISITDRITYDLEKDGNRLISGATLSMELADGKRFGKSITPGTHFKTSSKEVDSRMETPLYRFSSIEERYSELRLSFIDYAIEFRLYDQGMAYRFSTSLKKDFAVMGEEVSIPVDKVEKLYIPYSSNTRDPYATSFESRYTISGIDEWQKDRIAFLPLLVKKENGVSLLISEANIESYPGMFLTRGSDKDSTTGTIIGTFAARPSQVQRERVRCTEIVTSRSDTLALCKGKRRFPWRIISVADNDKDLPVNTMTRALADDSRVENTEWIRPGKVAWDWWNDWSLSGVDFKAGINTQTYKYFIDFASANGIEYIVLDEGWSEPSKGDIMSVIPELDLNELVSYGQSKGVGVILWAVAYVLDAQLEQACRHYSEMGIKGFKIDFIDRDDQCAVETIYRILECCAQNRLIVDLHGMYKPAGLDKTYPNAINFEGVWGLEQMKWSNDDMITYDVTFPYIRMASGPVDYTQGALRNAARNCYSSCWSRPMSQGTRARQVAEYIIFDSPLVMLCDSPSDYMKEQETLDFIAGIPTVWDYTRVLDGAIGEYIVTLRNKEDEWYIGGINGHTRMTITVDLSEIPKEKRGSFTIFADGANASKTATDYKIVHYSDYHDQTITLELAPGGGFTIRFND